MIGYDSPKLSFHVGRSVSGGGNVRTDFASVWKATLVCVDTLGFCFTPSGVVVAASTLRFMSE